MKDLDNEAFISLFKESYEKCFGFPLNEPLSETESKHFANELLQETGLVIGAKSIKNYSFYVLHPADSKPENPSVATLDTLARYVLNAPYTDELQRKANEAHFPYWFQYKNKIAAGRKKKRSGKWQYQQYFIFTGLIIIVSILLLIRYESGASTNNFMEDFHSVQMDTLAAHGWFIKDVDTTWWAKRNKNPGELTFFTLRGDNWPDSVNTPVIKNLLLQKISSDCFSAEVHVKGFVPGREWQQAGILLMEDTSFKSKCVRLSIAYNDFFGGFPGPEQIIIQAISTGGKGVVKPEELLHEPLFNPGPGNDSLIANNMQHVALRIEKNKDHFRFLYSVGRSENFAFKEAFSGTIDFSPKYAGIFALKGFVNDTTVIPVRINFFSLAGLPCGK